MPRSEGRAEAAEVRGDGGTLAVILLNGAGVEPERIGMMNVLLSGPAYRQKAEGMADARRVLDSVGRAPGVQMAAIGSVAGSGVVTVEGGSRSLPNRLRR